MPAPKKDSPASMTTALANPTVAWTRMGAIEFGSTCQRLARRSEEYVDAARAVGETDWGILRVTRASTGM